MEKVDNHKLMTEKDAMIQVLRDGPQKVIERIQEFCSDINQLVKAMQVLFEQGGAALLIFGVEVTVKVTSEDLGELLSSHIGAQLVDTNSETGVAHD